MIYFIGPRCKDTKDTELPCNTKPKYPPWVCLAFLSSSFFTAIEGWFFPPAVSSRNNVATDFKALVREEPWCQKIQWLYSPLSKSPAKSLWTFYLYSKLHCWKSYKTSRTTLHLESPQLPIPENTPKSWLQLRETAHFSPLSNLPRDTKKIPQDVTQTIQIKPLLWIASWRHISVSADCTGSGRSLVYEHDLLLSPAFSFPTTLFPKQRPLTDALASTLLTMSPSNLFSSSS